MDTLTAIEKQKLEEDTQAELDTIKEMGRYMNNRAKYMSADHRIAYRKRLHSAVYGNVDGMLGHV